MVLSFLKAGYQKIKNFLAKTGSLLGQKIRNLFQGSIDESSIEQLEQLFYEADLGVKISQELTEKVRQQYKTNPHITAEEVLPLIKKELLHTLNSIPRNIKEIPFDEHPLVILIIGVNGNGKTTTIAKLGKRFKQEGKKVLVAAADTFRAAATEQLEMWAKKADIEIVKGKPHADPAAVAFDGITAAKARNCQVILIDTAGRLHTKTPLMEELEKIKRSCQKVSKNSPHETLLILDATTGQNAIDQAKIFQKYTPITGLVLTKLDGTAKGGIVIAIQRELGIPVKFIGVGEAIDDLEPFDPENFVSALLG